MPSVCPFGASGRSGLELGHRKVELLHGARPYLGGQVRIALCHAVAIFVNALFTLRGSSTWVESAAIRADPTHVNACDFY